MECAGLVRGPATRNRIHCQGAEQLLDRFGVPEQEWSIGYGQAYQLDGLKLYANWVCAAFTA